MQGKDKCRILKEIRSEIAKNNNIEYVTEECKFNGECKGTCPKCEAELKYLEEELKKRNNVGKKVAVAGIAAASVLSISTLTACDFNPIDKIDKLINGGEEEILDGDIEYIPDDYVIEELEGDVAFPIDGFEDEDCEDDNCEETDASDCADEDCE